MVGMRVALRRPGLLEDAGHISPTEQPEAVNAALAKFLAGLQQAEQSSTGRPARIQPAPE